MGARSLYVQASTTARASGCSECSSAASGIGALTGTFIVASLGDFERKGLLIVGGALAFGALLVMFSLSSWLPLSLALLVAIGMSTSLYMTSTMTMLQMNVDDRFRGRVMGVSGLTYSLMPLGGVLSGTVADAFGAPTAVAIGGLAVLLFTAFVGTTQQEFRRAWPVAQTVRAHR